MNENNTEVVQEGGLWGTVDGTAEEAITFDIFQKINEDECNGGVNLSECER